MYKRREYTEEEKTNKKQRDYVLGRYRNMGNSFHDCNVLSREGVLLIDRRIHKRDS